MKSWQTIIKENDLDVSIVNSIDLNEELRIDAEYHKPKYLREETALLKLSRMSIGEFCFVTDGQHGYHEEDESSDIRFLTAKMREIFSRMAKMLFASLNGWMIKTNDLLFNRKTSSFQLAEQWDFVRLLEMISCPLK